MADYVLSGYYPPMGVYSKDDVKQVQQQLNASGANLKVDGIWGPATNAAYYAGEGLNSGSSLYNSLSGAGMSSAFSGMNFGTTPYDIGPAYDAAGEYYKQAVDAAYASNKANLDAQASALTDQYNALRNQAYVNARLNAIGNNEILASQGLAGNLYDNPVSGVSETSRVAQNVGMRNDINAANRQENAERDAIALEIIKSGYTRDAEYAKWMADMQIAKANAEMQAAQQAFENSLALAGLMASMSGGSGGGSSGGGGYSSGGRSGRGSSGSGIKLTDDEVRYTAAQSTLANGLEQTVSALDQMLNAGQITPWQANMGKQNAQSIVEHRDNPSSIGLSGWI